MWAMCIVADQFNANLIYCSNLIAAVDEEKEPTLLRILRRRTKEKVPLGFYSK